MVVVLSDEKPSNNAEMGKLLLVRHGCISSHADGGNGRGSTAPPTLTSLDPCFPLLNLIVERLEHLV